MKALSRTAFLLEIILFILISRQSIAQSGTLVVYANGLTIDKIISADASNGIQKHSTYQLVSRDTTYLLDATITMQSSVSITGVPDPVTGKLPCIETNILQNGSITGIFFTLTGKGTRVTLKNLYLLGIAPNSVSNTGTGQGVQISADSISLTIDNCVFDEMSQYEIAYSSNWDKFYITNTKFRNGIFAATSYYWPELLRSENYEGNWSTDTIYIKYNTLLCVGMGPVNTTGITHSFEFSHNDVILTSKGPFWSEQVVNAKMDNNIFYNVYAVGESHFEYADGWDDFIPSRVPSIFYFSPLDSINAALFLGHSRIGTQDSLAAEKMRIVEVKNNVYYWSSGLTSFWTSWNDTAKIAFDTLYTPVFMNVQSAAMFGNSVWPGFVQSGNQNVDPDFGSTINKVLNPGSDTTYGVGLLAWIASVRNGTGTTQSFSYQKTQVKNSANWTPLWPLPESADLKYSNTFVKDNSTDALPLGDPYWFNGAPYEPSSIIPGDVDENANGGPDAYSASLILKYLAGLDTLNTQQLAAAEVDGNSGITANDAYLILYASTYGTFPAGVLSKPGGVQTGDVGIGQINSQENSNLVTIPIILQKSHGIHACYIELNINSSFADVENVAANIPRDWLMVHNYVNGILKIAMAGITPLTDENMAAISLNLKYKNARFNISGSALLNANINSQINSFTVQTVPLQFGLSQNYPNPFNPTTTIKYQLARDSHVSLTVYDILGQKVRTLVNGLQQAGYYNITWNGNNDTGNKAASGIYIYRLQSGNFIKTLKMNLLK
jgi:hypothetical protein